MCRFHGSKLAEMPFAGTLPHYQKQGLMRRLVNAVEQVLVNINI
jgi:GNAT superfamily N-acetyltransferase